MAGDRPPRGRMPAPGRVIGRAVDTAHSYGLPRPAARQLVAFLVRGIADAAEGISDPHTRPAADVLTWFEALAQEASQGDHHT